MAKREFIQAKSQVGKIVFDTLSKEPESQKDKVNNLKNIHLLKDVVTDAIIEKMEGAARDHKRYSNIVFKIIEVRPKTITWQASQGKSEHVFTKKRLEEITRETFGVFFPAHGFRIGAIPYATPACDVVDAEWIIAQMKAKGVRLKKIADDTGMSYTYLSELVNGGSPLSQVTKAMFYYYFLSVQIPEKSPSKGSGQ